MADQVYIDEFDLTPEEEPKKETEEQQSDPAFLEAKEKGVIPVPGLGKEPEVPSIADIILEPDVELKGDVSVLF